MNFYDIYKNNEYIKEMKSTPTRPPCPKKKKNLIPENLQRPENDILMKKGLKVDEKYYK